MTVLDLFLPTKTRQFTYYERCAIALDAEEMVSTRLRVTVSILGTPLERSLNLRYPYFKEFYGYAQFFWQNTIIDERSINYTDSIIWDYWNQHSTLAHQLLEVFNRLGKNLIASGNLALEVNPGYSRLQEIVDAIVAALDLTRCLEIELPGGQSFLNTFVHPWNLIRLKFAPGTVFQVTIESWIMSPASDQDFLPGNPNTDEPYDTDNPNGSPPDRTPGPRNPENPYGENPPESSPLDPNLDPGDFVDAPNPPDDARMQVEGWFIPAIPGVQSEGYVVTCGDVASLNDVPGYEGIQNAQPLGLACAPITSSGVADNQFLADVYPGFLPDGSSANLTGPNCPLCDS